MQMIATGIFTIINLIIILGFLGIGIYGFILYIKLARISGKLHFT